MSKYNSGYWERQMDLIKFSGPDDIDALEPTEEYEPDLNQDGKLNFGKVNIDILTKPMTWQEQHQLHVKSKS